MGDWKECRIGKVVSLQQGLCINSKSNHLLDNAGYPLLRITDLINNTEVQYINKEKVNRKFLAKKTDLIYTRTGQVGYIFKGREGIIHNNCFKIIPNNGVNKDYLYWFLKTKSAYDYSNSVATGSAQPDLGHTPFKSMPFRYPLLQTQKKIAAILSAYDELIENNNRRIALLEKMAEELYREWFVRMRFPGHEKVKFHKGVPEGWEVNEISNLNILIIDGDRGKFYPKKDEFSNKGHCLFLNTGNIKNNKFVLIECDFINKKRDNLLKKGKLKYDDIVLTTRGTIGNIAHYNKKNIYENVRINSGMVILRSLDNNAFYYYYLLKSDLLKEQYKLYSSGAAQPQLPIKDLKRIKVIVPKNELMNEFCKLVESLTEKNEYLNNCNYLLKQSRDQLLPRLISGKLNVDKLDIKYPPGLEESMELKDE